MSNELNDEEVRYQSARDPFIWGLYLAFALVFLVSIGTGWKLGLIASFLN